MPQPYDYRIQRPDIMGAFGAYQAGRQENFEDEKREREKMFGQYLPGALKGNEPDLEQAQKYATPDQQIQLSQLLRSIDDRTLAQKKEQQDKFARLAQWADTPEKWAHATAQAEAEGVKGAGQTPFERRGAIVAQMMTIGDQLDSEFKRRSLALDESRTAAQNAASYASARASDAAASRKTGVGGIDNTTFDNMSGLRREFTAATKTYAEVRDAFGRIQASANNPSAAGDLSLIFNYMKVLDPGSTVREGEFATAQNAAGIPERIVSAYNQALNGERLNKKQRADFVNRAGMLFNRQHQTYLATKRNYDSLAERFGFDPSLVTFDQSGGIVGPQAAPPAPQSFVRGGAGVFSQDQGGQPAQAQGSIFDQANRIIGRR